GLHPDAYILCFFLFVIPRPPPSPLFPYTTLFRSSRSVTRSSSSPSPRKTSWRSVSGRFPATQISRSAVRGAASPKVFIPSSRGRSEEHTSELHHVAISYAVFCLKKKKQKELIDDA